MLGWSEQSNEEENKVFTSIWKDQNPLAKIDRILSIFFALDIKLLLSSAV